MVRRLVEHNYMGHPRNTLRISPGLGSTLSKSRVGREPKRLTTAIMRPSSARGSARATSKTCCRFSGGNLPVAYRPAGLPAH
jgi:hypothetical protein